MTTLEYPNLEGAYGLSLESSLASVLRCTPLWGEIVQIVIEDAQPIPPMIRRYTLPPTVLFSVRDRPSTLLELAVYFQLPPDAKLIAKLPVNGPCISFLFTSDTFTPYQFIDYMEWL